MSLSQFQEGNETVTVYHELFSAQFCLGGCLNFYYMPLQTLQHPFVCIGFMHTFSHCKTCAAGNQKANMTSVKNSASHGKYSADVFVSCGEPFVALKGKCQFFISVRTVRLVLKSHC